MKTYRKLSHEFDVDLDQVQRRYIRIPATFILYIVFVLPLSIVFGIISVITKIFTTLYNFIYVEGFLEFFIKCLKGPKGY